MASVIEAIFLAGRIVLPPTATQDWDRQVGILFNSLSYADFSDWLARSPEGQEVRTSMLSRVLSQYIACNLQSFNDKVARWLGSGSDTFNCICYGDQCCAPNESCPNPDAKRRLKRTSRPDSRAIERRVTPYDWEATRNGISYSGTYLAPDVRALPTLALLPQEPKLTSPTVAEPNRLSHNRRDMAACVCTTGRQL